MMNTGIFVTMWDMVSLAQVEVYQGEGKSPVTVDICYDAEASKIWRDVIKERVRQFSLAIQAKYGYHVVLRRQRKDDIDVLYCDVREAKQSWVFLVNDFMCEVQIHREAI